MNEYVDDDDVAVAVAVVLQVQPWGQRLYVDAHDQIEVKRRSWERIDLLDGHLSLHSLLLALSSIATSKEHPFLVSSAQYGYVSFRLLCQILNLTHMPFVQRPRKLRKCP